jgi:hypothetical protein
MTPEQRLARFLETLARKPDGATGRDLPPGFRNEDRARQKCRQNGWATYEARPPVNTKRWHITEAGRAALEALKAAGAP